MILLFRVLQFLQSCKRFAPPMRAACFRGPWRNSELRRTALPSHPNRPRPHLRQIRRVAPLGLCWTIEPRAQHELFCLAETWRL